MIDRKEQIIPSMKAIYLAFLFLFSVSTAQAATDNMNNFCSTPPFVITSVTPNLLMMFDNSASMNDLQYIDLGSGSRTPTYCYDETYKGTNTYVGYFKAASYYDYNFANFYFSETASFPADSACANPNTLTKISNTLYVCYNSTSRSVSRFLANGSYLNWLSMSKFDIEKQILTGGKYDAGGQTLTAESRGCVGYRYIKQPLTSDYVEGGTNTPLGVTFGLRGPYDPYNPSAPSPGGQTYIDIFIGQYNAATCQTAMNDFADLSVNKNTLINDITDCVTYSGSQSKTCQYDTAITCSTDANCGYSSTAGTCGSVTTNGTCGTPSGGVCSLNTAGTCATNNGTCPATTGLMGVCVGGSKAGTACDSDSPCKGGGTCTRYCIGGGKVGAVCGTNSSSSNAACAFSSCTAGDTSKTSCSVHSDCDLKKCTNAGATLGQICTTNSGCNSAICIAGNVGVGCSLNSDCNMATSACTAPAANIGHLCAVNTDCDLTVIGNGHCQAPLSSSFSSVYGKNMHTCYQVLFKGQTLQPSDLNWFEGCDGYYPTYMTCLGGSRDGVQCTGTADCPSGTCINGPNAVRAGSLIYACSSDYAGACATSKCSGGTKNGIACMSNNDCPGGGKCWTSTTWDDTCVSNAIVSYCGAAQVPNVTDPTENASATAQYANVPAILSDSGIMGQLGDPIAQMPVQIHQTVTPTGLIQQFGNSIRLGAMMFNIWGSPTECSTTYPPPANSVPCPKICSTDPARICGSNLDCPLPATATCTTISGYTGPHTCYYAGSGQQVSPATNCASDTDCGIGQTCIPNNKDAAQVVYYIGYGTCYDSTTKTQIAGPVRCTIDAHCGANQYCQSDGVGDHGSGLISTIDGIRGATWTPFAEAFYDAIGYFAKNSGDATGKTSRTDLRMNSGDYNANYNPSNVRCQANNILLVTDGMSTSDQNAGVKNLATTYNSQSALYGGSGLCTSYAGSTFLENLSWLGYHRNISTFSKTIASTAAPVNNNEKISTYVVFDGSSNGGTGDCNAQTLLANTATNGNTQLKTASDPTALNNALQKTLQEISSKAASGSAVSVLTTSARGVGSMLQAYFFPTLTLDSGRQINWLGYTQNIWIDPNDNIRDDYSNGTPDAHLILNQDRVLKFNTDPASGVTKAGLFTTLADGSGGGLASCQTATVSDFTQIIPLWEGGKKLAQVTASDDGTERNIFTAIQGGTGMSTAGGIKFGVSEVTGDATLSAALNPDAIYSATQIVQYTRGEPLETALFSGASYTNFRDRTQTDGSVWKLGDVINSTPRVVGNIPQNTYFIDYGDASYFNFISSDTFRHRSSIAVIGANDGMLHAFRLGYLKDRTENNISLGTDVKALFRDYYGASDNAHTHLGEETWAYIPYNALPYLKYYASPAYANCHIYAVDLSAKLVDASVNGNPTDAKTASGWRTLLIGGMRFGGSCPGGVPDGPPSNQNVGFSSFFALDLTDYLAATATTAPGDFITLPTPLWEFTDADLGYTTSSPAIIRTGNASQNGNWYVVLGSGPKKLPQAGQDIDRNSTGYLYVLNLQTGALVKKIGLTDQAIVGDILSIDANKDYLTEKAYFGTSYKNGSAWAGKIMSLSIPSDVTNLCGSGSGPFATCSALKTLFSGSYPFTASPDAVKDEKGNVWVYAGSGKYYSALDEQDSSQQVFLGLIDSGTAVTLGTTAPSDSCPASCSSTSILCNVSNCKTTGTVPTQGGTTQVCTFDGNTSSLQTIVTSVTNPSTAPQSPVGWVIYLPNSKERVISRPLAVGGIVDFLSYVPSADICARGGNTNLYAVDYTKGVASSSVAIQAYGSTTSDPAGNNPATSGTVYIQRSVNLGKGAPPTGEAIIITPPKENQGQEKLKKKIQVSTGVIVETVNKPAISTVSKILQWLKK